MPTSFSVVLSFYKVNDVANELLHGAFTYLFTNILVIFLSLMNLSASNDVNLHSQGHIEEQYSSVP